METYWRRFTRRHFQFIPLPPPPVVCLSLVYARVVYIVNMNASCLFPQIIIHTPVEVPTTINGYIRIPSNQETVIMLKPNLLRTNNALRTYDPIGRQCYYETERYLRFFRVYTQRNCEMECITNYTVTKCGCSAFYLPSKCIVK